MSAPRVVAIDLGGTKCAAALVDPDGVVTARRDAPTPGAEGPLAILALMSRLAHDLAAMAADQSIDVVGLGLGCAGVIDAATGTVLSATDVLRDWAGTEVRAALSELSGIRTIVVDNDVHMHALGEAWRGAATRAPTAFFVGVGTGVGSSFVVDGAPLRGAHNVAGHLGHMPCAQAHGLSCVCGGSGHLEAVAAGPAMVRAYNRHASMPLGSLTEVCALAVAGDTLAARALETGASALGAAVGGGANLLDPEVVVIGGGVVGAGAAWWQPMERAVRAELLPPLRDLPVVPAALGGDAALVGAAHLVWKELG